MESQKAMATETGDHPRATRTATTVSSFSRSSSSSLAALQTPTNPGVKLGPNGAAFVSSGIPDLDRILGGGFLLGSLVMIMEDADAPHHLLLLRNFMSQGVVHRQPVLFASPLRDPRAFLGTLPSPISSSKEQSIRLKAASPDQQGQEKDLRIAWQYKKYFGDQQSSQIYSRDVKQEFSNDFDLRKPLERKAVQYIDCVSIQDTPDLAILRDQCSNFLSSLPRCDNSVYSTSSDGSTMVAGRIAVQSFCAPQCGYSEMDWDMVAFIRFLRSMTRSANAVAVVTFPSSYLRPSFLKRWQHLADTLLAVRAIPDEDKDLAKLLTGYQDMLGLLHVHKVAQMNTQLSEFVEANLKLAGRDCVILLVPTVLEASTFSLKLHKRRSLVLERLNQAPVEASSGTSYSTTSSCSGPSHGSSLDF